MQDGRVGFSRWEHLENVNDVKLFAMNPDCTQMIALSGQHGKPGNSVVQVTEIARRRNVFYGVVTERENTIQAGALVKIDARCRRRREPRRRGEDRRRVHGAHAERADAATEPSPVGRYRSPAVLPDGRLLVSWADGRRQRARTSCRSRRPTTASTSTTPRRARTSSSSNHAGTLGALRAARRRARRAADHLPVDAGHRGRHRCRRRFGSIDVQPDLALQRARRTP